MDIQDLRREYCHDGLEKSKLNENPLDQFNVWLSQAIEADLIDPTAMTVATVDVDGQPSQRVVLLKQADENGFVFYTNLESKKANDIDNNAKVSLHFAWLPLERQVKIQGIAKVVSPDQALQYFNSRPRDSQLAAWSSHQSRPLASRQVLESEFETMKSKFSDQDIPLPSFWGGYRIEINRYEFWQGGKNRLHDCFSYEKTDESKWRVNRLAP